MKKSNLLTLPLKALLLLILVSFSFRNFRDEQFLISIPFIFNFANYGKDRYWTFRRC